MMAAQSCDTRACVGLAPSTLAQRYDASVQIRSGVFGPEEYGIVHRDPDRQLMMPDLDRDERLIALNALAMESRVARDERKRGITIEKLECLLLVVTGTADSNGRANGMRTCTSRGNTSRQRVHLTGGWC